MPDTETLIAFLLAASVFAYVPGPSMLYAAAQTLSRGRRAGWFAALGIHIGGYVHVIAATLGIAALLAAVPTIYVVLKLTGAAYLVWLGIGMWRTHGEASLASIPAAQMSPRRAFTESVTVEVLNPKTAMFYLAFLPQFTDPAAALPLWAQLLVLGAFVNLLFSSADVLFVALADKIASAVSHGASGTRMLQRLGGTLLIGLGVNLALNRG